MKIVAASDIHGKINQVQIPPCDLLIIPGDFCPWHRSPYSIMDQAHWVNTDFAKWLAKQPVKQTVIVPGNHDWVFEKNAELVAKIDNCTIITDGQMEWNGLVVAANSYQPFFFDWAFNLPDDGRLFKKYQSIPNNTDILVTHCPPFGHLDQVMEGNGLWGEHLGSKMLANRMAEIVPNVKVHCFGHIHSSGLTGYNHEQIGGTHYYNVSIVDESYRVVNKPTEIEI